MASLILGGIGGYMFGPIGFLAGSLLGNLLFPQKQEGPRLSNLKLQGSNYGAMIPICYGTIRLSGQVIWQTDLQEHQHSSGGKGGPSVTTYTYTASFAVKICKGPIAGILTIWANGEVIYDTSGQYSVNNSAVPVTIYLGVEGAPPDPTMEGILGVGNVPAFQDDAVCVFTDWDLGNFGNTLPQLSFLVFATGGPIPWRVSSFTTIPGGGELNNATWDGTNVTVWNYTDTTGTSGGPYYTTYSYALDGTPGATVGPSKIPGASSGDGYVHALESFGGGSMGGQYPYVWGIWGNPIDGTIHGGWCYNGMMVADGGMNSSTRVAFGSTLAPILDANGDGYIFAVNGNIVIHRFSVSAFVPATTFDASYTFPNIGQGTSDYGLIAGDNGLLYVWIDAGSSGSQVTFYEMNPDLTVSRSWTKTQMSGVAGGTAYKLRYVIYKGMLCVSDSQAHFLGHFDLYQLNTGLAPTFIGSLPVTGDGAAQGGLLRFDNGYCLTYDGIISLDPPPEPVTLRSIVEDVSARCGLTVATDVDATALTQLVDGYMISTRTDARSDLDPLRAAYFFDAVEQQGKAVFVNRGGDPAVTIPQEDLAAQEEKGQPPPVVEVARAQEIDLPVSVNVTYINKDASYQDGSQEAIRQTVLSQSVADVKMPIAMGDAQGRKIANVLLFEAWVERNAIKFQTTREYAYLEPTDVVTLPGPYTVRIDKKTHAVSGLIKWEGKASNAAIYTVALASNATSGGTSPVAPSSQPTQLVMLDIPLVTDNDPASVAYAAMAGSVDTTWKGAALFKSSDGGSSYSQVASSSGAAVIGRVATALGGFAGGNMFDEANTFTVVIGAGGGTLSAATELGVLNGANMAVLGNELLQFKNATLTAPSTYAVSGLLRGRRGTEWAINTHAPNECFVLLPVVQAPVAIPGDLGQTRLYKAVSYLGNIATTDALSFFDSGLILSPYSPTDIRGGPDGSGNVVINWTRRTRIGGQWLDYVDVPLSEPSEAYVVQIYDSTYTNVARIITSSTETCTYTASQQTTDFGATQQHIYCTVGQLGAYGLGRQQAGVVPGAGASDGSVIAPIPPYNSPPPQGGSTCPAPVDNEALTWNSSINRYVLDFPVGTTICGKFTTNTNVGKGSYNVVEYGGPPSSYYSWVSTSPCGANVDQSNSQGISVGKTLWNGPNNPHPSYQATLAESTTYYLNIQNQLVDTTIALDFQGT